MMKQVAIFGMHIASAHRDFLAISREFELVDEVYHAVSVDQQVEISRIFKGEHILFLCFEIDNWL